MTLLKFLSFDRKVGKLGLNGAIKKPFEDALRAKKLEFFGELNIYLINYNSI